MSFVSVRVPFKMRLIFQRSRISVTIFFRVVNMSTFHRKKSIFDMYFFFNKNEKQSESHRLYLETYDGNAFTQGQSLTQDNHQFQPQN